MSYGMKKALILRICRAFKLCSGKVVILDKFGGKENVRRGVG